MEFSQAMDFSSLFCSPQQVTAATAPHGNIGYPWLPSGSVGSTSNPVSTGSHAHRNATKSSNGPRLSSSAMLDTCGQQAAEDDAYYMAIATRICKDVSAMDDDDDDAVPSFLPPTSTTTTEEHDHDLSKNPSHLLRGGSAQSTSAVVVGSGCTSFTTDASGGICTGGTHHGKHTNGTLLSADRPNQTADGSDVLGSGGSPPTSHSPCGAATTNTVVQSLSVQALAQRQQTGTNSQGSSIGSQANNNSNSNNVFRDKPKATSQGVGSTTGNSSATMGGGGGTNANHPISYGVAHQANQPQPHAFNTAPPNSYVSNGNGNHHQKHFSSGGQSPGVMPGPHLGMATRAVMPQPPPSPPQLPPTVTLGTGSSVVPNGNGSYGTLLASANPPPGSTAHLLPANGMSPSQQQGPPMPGVTKTLTDHNPNHTSAMPMAAITSAGSTLDRNPVHKPSNHVNPSTVNVNSSGSTNPQQPEPILYNPQLQTQSAMAARMVPAATVQQQQQQQQQQPVLLRATTATPRSPMFAAATPMQAPSAQQHHQPPQPQVQQQTTQGMGMPGVAPVGVMSAGASGHMGNSVAQPPQQYYVLQQPTQQPIFAISQQQPQQIVLVTPQQQQQQQRQHLSMQVMTAGGAPGATYPTPGGASVNNQVNRVIMVGGRPYVLPPGASAAVDASGRLIFVANAPAGNPTPNVVNTTNVGNANGAPTMMMPPSHASMALAGGSGGMHGVPLTHGGGSLAPTAMSGGSIVGMPQGLAWGGSSSMSFQQGPTQPPPPPPPPASMPAQQAVLIGLPHGTTPQQTPFMISQPMQQWWPQP